MTAIRWGAVLIVFCSLVAVAQNKGKSNSATTKPSFFGHNLLKNPGAAEEVEPGKVKDWPGESVSTSTYGHTSGEWDWNVEGAPKGGCCYFRLAWDGEISQKEMSQEVDLSPAAQEIDAGGVTATASAYLGSMVDSNTAGQLSLTFLDAQGQTLSTLQADVVKPDSLPKPSVGSASMVSTQTSGEVPKGARKAVFKITSKTNAEPGGDYAAYADNLSLVLVEPKPH